jgi:hypothetical protein
MGQDHSLSKFTRLLIYDFLTPQEQATKLSCLCKAERQMIIDSHLLTRVRHLKLFTHTGRLKPLTKDTWLLKFASSVEIVSNGQADAA